MKNLILLTLLISFNYFSSFGQACGGAIIATETGICVGESTLLSIEPTTQALTTSLAAGNNQNGNMFDVTAFNDVVVTGFEASPINNSDYEIYYKVGTYLGFEANSAAWTLLGNKTGVPSTTTGNTVDLDISLNLTIPAGQTYSFYVTTSNGVNQRYTTGTDESAEIANDGNIRVTEGIGLAYPFSTVYRPRIFNGIVKYHLAQTYAWSNGTTGSTLNASPTQSTLYAVTATCSNGSTSAFTQDITVSSSVVDITATQLDVCNGASTTLNAITTVNTSISTAFDSNNGSDGNMFDVEALNDLTIKGVDGSYNGTVPAQYEIYGKPGTFSGFETDASAWTLLGSTTLSTPGDAIPIPIALNVSLNQGETYALYVTQQRESNNIHRYTNGSAVGAPLVEDANLRLREGVGKEYPFGQTFSPRNFNGRIHYEAKSSANLTWNTGAIAGAIVVSPTAPTTYSVTSTSNVGACTSMDDIHITHCGDVAIEDLYKEYAVNVFPNPASKAISVSIEGLTNKDLNLSISNVQGQVLFAEELSTISENYQHHVDVSQFANGLYFVRLTLEGQHSIHKVMVSR